MLLLERQSVWGRKVVDRYDDEIDRAMPKKQIVRNIYASGMLPVFFTHDWLG